MDDNKKPKIKKFTFSEEPINSIEDLEDTTVKAMREEGLLKGLLTTKPNMKAGDLGNILKTLSEEEKEALLERWADLAKSIAETMEALGTKLKKFSEAYEGFENEVAEEIRKSSPSMTKEEALNEAREFLTNIDYEAEAKAMGVSEEELEQATMREVLDTIIARNYPPFTALAINTVFPKSVVRPVDKISNLIYRSDPAFPIGEKITIGMEKKGSTKRIDTFVTLDFDNLPEGVRIESPVTLNRYDRIVSNAITAIKINNDEYMTFQKIYRVMVGDNKARITKRHREEIEKSIHRLTSARITIDAKDELKNYAQNGDTTKRKYMYHGHLIAGEFITNASINGTPVDGCLRVFRTPVLYEYAGVKKQVATLDIKLLDTPVNNNPENMMLKDYLIERILGMKGSSLSRNILYSSIYEEMGLIDGDTDALKTPRKRIRDITKKMLGSWKEKGFISDFEEVTDKGELRHIAIELPPTHKIDN